MTFGAVGNIVFIFSVLVLVKLLFVLFKPKGWMDVSKQLYNSPAILALIELILAAIVFYYLLMELTIVQIMAGVVLGALLTGLSFASYGKEALAFGTKIMKDKNMWKKAWLPAVIWLVLAVWALYALFA